MKTQNPKNSPEKESREELEEKYKDLQVSYAALKHLVDEDYGKSFFERISPILVLILCIFIVIIYLKKWYIE